MPARSSTTTCTWNKHRGTHPCSREWRTAVPKGLVKYSRKNWYRNASRNVCNQFQELIHRPVWFSKWCGCSSSTLDGDSFVLAAVPVTTTHFPGTCMHTDVQTYTKATYLNSVQQGLLLSTQECPFLFSLKRKQPVGPDKRRSCKISRGIKGRGNKCRHFLVLLKDRHLTGFFNILERKPLAWRISFLGGFHASRSFTNEQMRVCRK